jgi:integrase
MIRHKLLGGKLQVYKRENTQYWQCSASFNGEQYRATTKEEGLAEAREAAEDWYLGLRGKSKAGLLRKPERTFREAAEQFENEYQVITEGQRSPKWVDGHKIRIRLHLNPFFGDLGLSEVTPGKAQEYRVHRMKPKAAQEGEGGGAEPKAYKAPARSTLHDEIVTLRMVLKTAIRHGWLTHLPDLSPPYKTQGKVVHRPWFSPAEYKQLYEAAREHARKSASMPWQWNAEQVYDYILFLANTGLRPDEAKNLQHRDVVVVDDEATGERILNIEVRGKVGFGPCKSMPGAVRVYERLKNRQKPARGKEEGATKARELPVPTDLLFPGNHIKLFNGILRRSSLKLDREGNRRTAYSLRHTYICMRLMEGADVYQIAKNCRTSVEMIQKFYAKHIMSAIDTAAINIVRPRPKHSKRPARKAIVVPAGVGQVSEPPDVPAEI